MPLADLAERLWYGDGAGARAARAMLSPLSALYGVAIARINAASDRTPMSPAPIAVVSIGNLTVGGTGKTPVSAWFASRLQAAGATPAIVLRGYGGDEVLVHRLLNPAVPVLADAKRTRGVQRAAQDGADVAILDDAFQHRRAARDADVVLVSADRWTGDVRLLPAGPFREPLASLGRASLVIVTVKAAADAQVRATLAAVRGATSCPVACVDLAPTSFVNVATREERALSAWRGARVLAVSAIGDPAAFSAQLTRLGLDVTPRVFPDHHPFDAADVSRLVQAGEPMDAVICTLKDAVKLGSQWPGSARSLWYLSQSVVPRDGADALDVLVRSVLQARRNGPTFPDLSR
ncbi:MAG: tetraacyldisaccharide 4'-kinase [Gemmatimonadota bacterium]